jgi:hypothetical protein
MFDPNDKAATQTSLPFSSTPSASTVGRATQAPLFRPHLAARCTLQQWSQGGAMPRYQG